VTGAWRAGTLPLLGRTVPEPDIQCPGRGISPIEEREEHVIIRALGNVARAPDEVMDRVLVLGLTEGVAKEVREELLAAPKKRIQEDRKLRCLLLEGSIDGRQLLRYHAEDLVSRRPECMTRFLLRIGDVDIACSHPLLSSYRHLPDSPLAHETIQVPGELAPGLTFLLNVL